jgi:hypothetical protein
MNKLLFILSLFSFYSVNAQFSFTDNFESYAVGDYIGEADTLWTTWSGTTGGTEDAQATDENSASGTNSIYFSSSAANGGPQDVVLPFGTVFDEGDFTFSANFYVNDNAGAYFNFQAETTIGTTWSMDCFMNSDGTVQFSTGGGETVFLEGTYPFDSWFNLEMNINLTLNQWQVMIDNNEIGTFENTINQVASLDIFPLNGNQFFIDDVTVSHQPFVPVGINAILSDLDLPAYVQYPADINVSGTVLNYGAETIESMDIVWTNGTNTYTENVTGLSLSTLESYDFTHTDQLSFSAAEVANLTVSIENVNADQDIEESNNTMDAVVNAVEFVTQKLPLFEHFTSNTCGPCASFNPGFQTLLDANDVNDLNDAKVLCIKYQVNWPGTGDQSFNSDVENRVSYYQVSSVPTAHVDGKTTSSSQAEIDEHRNMPSFLEMSGSAVATDGTDLAVELTVKSYSNYPNATIHIAIVEDQYNNTAGSNGETEFFQVMRKMLPSASGTSVDLSTGNSTTLSENTTVAVGNVTQNSFKIWEDLGNCKLVVFVIDEDASMVLDSRIIEITGNTTVTPTWACEPSGCKDPGTGQGEYTTLEDCEAACVSDVDFWNAIDVQLMPNPAQDNLSIELNTKAQNVKVSIYSITGQLVNSFDYGSLEGRQTLPMNIRSLISGIYTVQIQLNEQMVTHQLIKR